ncbi:MAG TPA: S8 family serine peptidase, partial [Prosthecobacter sp.]|nr:S8 family serine peptidase [Prosthecobacter sp.]
QMMAAARPRAEDRFAGLPVLEEKLHEARAAGESVTRRLRLVRDESFKHPLIRVEDEMSGGRLLRQRAMVADHVMVKPLDPRMPEADLLKRLDVPGASVRRRMPASGVWLVAFPLAGLETVPDALARFARLRDVVRVAEPDYIVHAGTTAYPNDPSFNELWGMDNTGQSGGVADADIDAPEAWSLHTGSSSVVVAVIDSGMDMSHPDLHPNLWTNPGEIPGNGIDDDGNGYVDDAHGWNFVNNTYNPQDDHGHGTHCAGTIGAAGDNSEGVAGVCWEVSLMPLKFLDSSGNGTLADAVEAVAYSTMMGVTLSSNSWGGGGFSQALLDEIVAADSAGILFVAAAGNAALNMDVTPDYPGSYNVPNLITVASTTSADGLSSFSNFGLTTTHLGAPGSDIYSTLPGGGYGFNSGTSMAAPHVSGACALLKSFKPGLTHHQMRALVLGTVDAIPALQGRTVTGGRLNAFSALMASDDILLSPSQELTVRGPVGGPFTPGAQVFTLSNQSPDTAPWSFSVNRSWVTLSAAEGVLPPGASTTVTATLNEEAGGLLAGVRTATFTLHNSGTGRSQTRIMRVRVTPPPLYSFDLDTDPGWARDGQWQHGAPQGQGALNFGFPDPASGATGSSVFGVNLAGDYTADPGSAQYLTAGPFDLTGMNSVSVRFKRWLNTDHLPWVEAAVEVSNDGVFWAALWDNGGAAITDSNWTEVEQDLSLIADGRPQVHVRWKHHVTASGAYPYSGWNLDDIEILGVPAVQLRMTLPASVEEGGSPVLAKITALPVLPSDLVVSLSSSRPGEKLGLPATVVIPAGEEEAEFVITPLQDTLVDGSQAVLVTASAAGYPSHEAQVLVHDDEQGALGLILPATAAEGAGV